MNYKILKWKHANKLKEQKSIAFILQIDFNLAKVYLLSDWTYLVMPFNPFSNWLLTDKQELLQKWIKERYFPVDDEIDRSYFERSRSLENLTYHKAGLKQALCDFIFKDGNRSPDELSGDEIDCIHEALKYRGLFARFKLNFIFLLGDYVISQRKDRDLHWGLLSDKQSLNPSINLIIVTDLKRGEYYDLEGQLCSRQGYAGVDHYSQEVDFGSESQAREVGEILWVM
jgi:hypothetical protein